LRVSDAACQIFDLPVFIGRSARIGSSTLHLVMLLLYMHYHFSLILMFCRATMTVLAFSGGDRNDIIFESFGKSSSYNETGSIAY
jgi:hypothetical protein